jgi:hypothetical protein
VDSSGQGLAGLTVSLRRHDALVATTMTGSDGRFEIAGLAGGIFEIRVGRSNGIYRLWAPQTAPPLARRDLLLVDGAGLVRGQGLGGFLTNPLVIAGLVAAAIAIPWAVHEHREDRRSGS